MKLIQPPFLKKGDAIALVAPAGRLEARAITFAFDILKGWGLEVLPGENLFHEYHNFSGTDEERAADLQQALDDPNVKAIISARGGYGTIRIIDKLDFSGFKKKPKWIVGYSDVTVLHSHLHALGFQSIHGTMPINFQENAEALESLRKVLFGEGLSYTIPYHALSRTGKATGVICGGNLSLLYAQNGSVSDIDTKGKILFIEDLDEYLYHLDRMMLNLKRSGKLSQLKALIVGGLTKMKDNETPFGKNAEEIVLDAVKEYDYPVCLNFPAGHISQNLALRMGADIIMEISDEYAVLSFHA